MLDKKYRVLISGDPIQDGNIFMFGVQREMHAYLHSIKKAQDFDDEYDAIYPSHGTFPVYADILQKLYDGASRILAGEVEGQEIDMFGNKVMRYDIGAAGFLCEK